MVAKYAWTVVDALKLEAIKRNADAACLGGTSWVRQDDRLTELSTDQVVGQLGEYGLARFAGKEATYFTRRERINLTPHVGDKGSDLDGKLVDVKCSLMRYSKEPHRYNLPVRPRERKSEIYVAAFVDTLEPPIIIILAGWALDSDLPPPEIDGIFRGAHVIPVPQLRPIGELKAKL